MRIAVEGTFTHADRRWASHAETQALLRRYQRTRDSAAREKLVRAYLPLVRAIARRYADRGEPLDDLVQVGALGLIEAIERFDAARGGTLGTFAIPTIKGRIRNHLRDRASCVRVPRRLAELSSKVRTSREELATRLSRSPTLAELARAVGASQDQVTEALESEQALVPLPLVGADGGRVQRSGDDPFRRSEDRMLLAAGFRVLTPRERRIIHLRFFGGLSQAEVAAAVGLSQVQVSSLIGASLVRMRAALEAEQLAATTGGVQ